jgi:hypothetical protein
MERMTRGQKVWWSALILTGAFVTAIFVASRFSTRFPEEGEIKKVLPEAPRAAMEPRNAFTGSRGGRLAPVFSPSIPSFDIASLPQFIASTTQESGLVIAPRAREAAPARTQSAPPPARSLLSLPHIEERELAVGIGGAQNFEEFAQAIIGSKAQFFDSARFATILREPDGIPYSITDLMKMGFVPEKWVAVKPSLLTLKEFVDARIAYVKTVRVSGDAVEFARTMVAFDTLTSGLLDEIVVNGGAPSNALGEKVAAYEATGARVNGEIGTRVRMLSNSRPLDLFTMLSRLLSFAVLPVHAQVGGRPPFGGKITYRMDCSACNQGFIIRLHNAVNKSPLTLFVSWATFGSPLFYINKNPNVSQNILGLYNRSSGQCEQPVCKGKCCPVDRYDGELYMAGTS